MKINLLPQDLDYLLTLSLKGQKKIFKFIVCLFVSFCSLSSVFAQAPVLNELTASDIDNGDEFGISMDMSEEHLVVGSPSVGSAEPGAVYVYLKMNDGTFGDEQKLEPMDFSENKMFGCSVGISGKFLAVGAVRDPIVGPHSGAVYVYKKDTTGIWGDEQKILAPDGETWDHFGTSVSLLDEYLVIGAESDDNGIGSVYIYKLNVDEEWHFLQKFVPYDPTIGARFGHSVDLSSDYLVVGAYLKDALRGSVYVYEKLSSGFFTNVVKLEVGDSLTADNAEIGRSVSVYDDIMVIGAPFDNGVEAATGSAYVFERDVDGNWVFNQKITLENGLSYDYFGYSVSCTNDHILIGAIANDANGPDLGNAFLYEKNNNGVWSLMYSFPSPYINANNLYGNSVSLSGSHFAIGAYSHFANSGRVYWGELSPTTSVYDIKKGAIDLFQNKPNPFSGSTRIGVLLDNNSSGSLSILDSSGRLVHEITKDFKKGYNEIHINGLNESGLYYYTIHTEKFTATKKMIVIE